MTTLRQARADYFAASGFDERTYTDDWVDIPFGPFPLRFPNVAARKQVVPLHDLHHALTGYHADLPGESEIGAWEIGSGIELSCWVGWYLDLLAMSWAVWFLPRRTFRAFVRGRRCDNFYQGRYEPAVLDQRVDDLRERMGLHRPVRAGMGDVLIYMFYAVLSLVVGLVSMVVTLPLMLALGIFGRFVGGSRA